jgi:hypothetical protein
MKIQGTLQKKDKDLVLVVEESEEQESGFYTIHSIIDRPKAEKLVPGSPVHGDVRLYSQVERQQMNWGDQLGIVYPGHFFTGVLKE